MKLVNFLLITAYLLLFSCSKQVDSTPPVTSAARIISEVQKVVVVLGSSTAFGTGALPLDSGWVSKLAYMFRDAKRNVSVHNLALGGFTTYHIMPSNFSPPAGKPHADLARNLDKALSYKPDLIIINLPSNDIAYGFGDNETLENYKIICSEITKHNIPFLVTSTQPRNFPEAHIRQRLVIANKIMKEAFPTNTIEFFQMLADPSNKIKPELDFGDGIHLNNKGHKIIFDEFLKDARMRLVLGY